MRERWITKAIRTKGNILLLMPGDSVLRRLLAPVSLTLLLCPALLNKAVKAVIVAAHEVLFPHLRAALARRPRLSRPDFIGNAGLASSLTRDKLFHNLERRCGWEGYLRETRESGWLDVKKEIGVRMKKLAAYSLVVLSILLSVRLSQCCAVLCERLSVRRSGPLLGPLGRLLGDGNAVCHRSVVEKGS